MSNIEYADIVADLSWGDTGKGKVVSHLCTTQKYHMVCRWAGGQNAGHTVYVNGEKYKTHLIPSGIFHNRLSIIGPGCVFNINKLLEELSYLRREGFNINLVKISPKAHIVTEEHLAREMEGGFDKKLGTTRSGIAPCYADKAARVGKRAGDCEALRSVYDNVDLIWDEKLYGNILCEGAQGFYLDLDHGNYPYVTSSTTLPYGACSIGFSPKKIRKIYGVAKMYDTRSGVDPDFPPSLRKDMLLERLGFLGKEIGTTTGRRRICNWLNLNKLTHAARVSGATDVIINKEDIIIKLDRFRLIIDDEIVSFKNIRSMKDTIKNALGSAGVQTVTFSKTPKGI